MEEPPQPLVASRIVRGIHRLVILAEELLVLSFGEVSEDHQRIGGVFRRLCGHVTHLMLTRRPQPVRRTSLGGERFKAGSQRRQASGDVGRHA